MKTQILILCLLTVAFCLSATAQSNTIDWYKVSGGGGTATRGVYSISATIGQPDASSAMSRGNYSVTGGNFSESRNQSGFIHV